jgi:hypothetical protein
MIVLMPPPQSSMTAILDTIRRAFLPVVSKDEATPRLLLQSPNGTIYEVTVSDVGALVTQVKDGKTRP